MEALFGGNLFFIYLFFVITVMNYSRFSIEQQLALIYICSFGLTFNSGISKWLVGVVLCIMLFLCQEYFTTDEKRIVFLYKFRYKIIDCLYMSFFQYRLLGVLAAIFIRSTYLWEHMSSCIWFVSDEVLKNLLLAISIAVLYWFSIHGIFLVKEKHDSFTNMYERIINNYPYVNVEFNAALDRRLNLIVDMEDHSYFQRYRSYSFVSMEYVNIWRNEHRTKKKSGTKKKKTFRDSWVYRLYSLIKKALFRGHSTIGMQLIRILSYKEGLIFGRPKNMKEAYRTAKRKVFECLYAKMFFDGMEKYMKGQLCNDLNNYRKYLVYLYPHIVQAKVKDITYVPMSRYFKNQEMELWDMNALFIACLGLNSLAVTLERIQEKREVTQKYEVEI